jgi:hypothetical protein
MRIAIHYLECRLEACATDSERIFEYHSRIQKIPPKNKGHGSHVFDSVMLDFFIPMD